MGKKPPRRAKPPTFAIESRGGVLRGELADVAPVEFRVKSKKERRAEQETAWAEFDGEFEEKIQNGELGVDPETGEVKKIGKTESR